MKTPPRSEGSVQFSLGELLKLEDERVAEQAREREAEARAQIVAAATAEREARAAEEAQARAEEAALAERRRAELDAMARREAMQRATVEQARLEVEARTRAGERERERQHELALQTARTAVAKPAGLGPLLAATGLGGGLMLVVVCILHFGVTQPAQERRLTELELRATTAEQKLGEAEANADRTRKTVASLEQHAAALEAENRSLRQAPPAPPTGRPPKTGPGSGPTRSGPAGKPEPGPCADEHDPMCFTIKPR